MVTTVTTTTATAISLQDGVFGAVALITLLLLLVGRELAYGAKQGRLQRFARSTAVGIVPLAIAFGLMVVAKLFG